MCSEVEFIHNELTKGIPCIYKEIFRLDGDCEKQNEELMEINNIGNDGNKQVKKVHTTKLQMILQL